MHTQRDQHLLIIAGVIGLIVGGLSGVVGGMLVATGKLGPLTSYFPSAFTEERGDRDVAAVRLSEESSTISVVRAASPAVVSIVVRKDVSRTPRGNFFDFGDLFKLGIPLTPPARDGADAGPSLRKVGGGSGFVVTSDGYIVTNRHVVLDDDAEYAVVLADDRELTATVLDRDPIHDIAILKVSADEPLPVLPLGNSDEIEIGETVIAIGYALSEYRNTVTKGVISGVNRRVIAGNGLGDSEEIHEAIQTDAAINPGNSGGPLLNLRGEVIGMNTAVSQEGQLVGFAIPVNLVTQAVESVVREGRIVRPWLGVRYVMVDVALATDESLPVAYGALIVRGPTPADVAVVPESPADRAGLHVNDLIIAVDGRRVDEVHPLVSHIARASAGATVQITFIRDGSERTIPVTLGEFPEK
ncbi:MAG: trypsin-like peptidase domain-containing protein [bacterium]|nr:trypsin-like peptidase domain-containing protein [bacterium]